MTTTLPRVPMPGLQADWPSQPAGAPPPRRSPFAFMRELPALIVFALTLAILIKTFLIQAFYIPSESMLPTFEISDRVLVNKFAYRFREPVRGEIIVFVAVKDTTERNLLQRIRGLLTDGLGVTQSDKEKDYIKRIIGLPGDTIEVTDAGVFVTPPGKVRFKVPEPYIASKEDQGPPQARFKVPAGHFFVMGDNRGNSADSRSGLGPIKREDIIGKAFVRIWPLRRVAVMEVPTYPPLKDAKPKAKAKKPAPRRSPTPRALDAFGVSSPAPVLAAGLALGVVIPMTRRRRR